jgi:predicted solute-binding protein
MYVNDWTLETGGKGRPAIERFLAEAARLELIPAEYKVEFV